MKKLGLFLLAGVMAAVLLTGCEEATTETEEVTTATEEETTIEYNTFDNNTSEEVIDLETGANLKDTQEVITEEEGIIPEDTEENLYDDDEYIPEETNPVDEEPVIEETSSTEA